MPINSHIILVLAWLIFGVLHSVLAYQPLKNRLQKRLKAKFKFYRLLYSLLAAISLAFVIWYQLSITSNLLWQPLLLQKIIAALMVVISIAFMGLCIKKYFADLSGIDALIKKNTIPHLETSGIHTLVRHPLYLATLGFIWGMFLWQPLSSSFISCICITLYTRIGIYFEEKKLIKLFGKDYLLYQVKVPMLLPNFF